ncbi:class I SAM-dependent methyltransferase [Pseudoduganella sp. R-34]|uniref:class I SAM-dependent methyltransferase n=1 Tax=Pseudoduganella sp. R-34 TaxID=3404062 RepID=UPI003CFB7B12
MDVGAYRNGVKAYTPFFLHCYDLLVIGIFTRYFWKCEGQRYIDIYRRHAGRRHADIGVGTGYFLDHAGLDERRQQIALIDLNPNCLRHTVQRLQRYVPDCHVRNAFEPIAIGGTVDSICIGGLIHCAPGTMRDKGRIFDAIAPLCAPGTTLFGYTLLGKDAPMSWYAKALMGFMNWLKVVDNREDSLDALHAELSQRFSQVEVWLVGCNAFFTAKNHKDATR